MAVNKGLHKYTVQESLNHLLGTIVRVTPVVIAGTTHDDDVMIEPTEIPNAVPYPGAISRLVGVTIIDKDGEGHNFDIVFSEVATKLGNIGDPTTITDGNLQAAKVTSLLNVDWSAGDESTIFAQDSGSASICTLTDTKRATNRNSQLPVLLKAASNSTSVYFQAVAREEAAWAAVDDLEFVFHIEYR